jgi:hypothetical protein
VRKMTIRFNRGNVATDTYFRLDWEHNVTKCANEARRSAGQNREHRVTRVDQGRDNLAVTIWERN